MLFALSMIGVPPLPGFWAKLLLVTGLVEANASLYLTALVVLLTATVIEAHYLMRTAILIYSKGKKKQLKKLHQTPFNLTIVSVFALVLIVALMTLAPLGNKLNKIAAESSDRALYIKTTFPAKKAPIRKQISLNQPESKVQ